MALEKGTFARRKAQKLARNGDTARAIEEMRLLVGEAERDPYDHVYLGDLLMREDRPQEALDAWMEAVHSYERAGLNRNAIAVGKKVLRLDRGRVAVHRTLGELYCREGLLGEAMAHFLHWLDTVNGDARFSEEFLATLERAGSAVGLQVEAALRVGDHYLRAGHPDRAARMLHGLADKVHTAGSPEMASELRERARAAEQAHEEQTAGVAREPNDPLPGAGAGEILSPNGLGPPDAFAVSFPASGGHGDSGGAPGDPFPDVIAAEHPDGGPVELPVEPPVEPSDQHRVDPLFEPSDEPPVAPPVDPPPEPPALGSVEELTESSAPSSAGPGTALRAGSLAESSSDPSEFLVEHFRGGGSCFELPAMDRSGPGGTEGPEVERAQADDRVEIDATADEVPGDDEERVWDLDAEQEALREQGATVLVQGQLGE